MKLPLRLLYIAVVQVIFTALVTYYLVTNEYHSLAEENVKALEGFLISQKQLELKSYTEIAMSSVSQLRKLFNKGDIDTQEATADILQSMLYNGDDGYFFVYDKKGKGIVHPKEPYRIGQYWLDLEDKNGQKVIQGLINSAQQENGYYKYSWNKPSENINVQKLAYAVYIDDWGWMLGTGVYLDDVYKQLSSIQNEINNHLNNTKQIILLVAISSIFFIFIFGIAINLSHKKTAEAQISKLGQKVIDIQEEENRHISRELHDGIIQILISIKYSLEATGLFMKKSGYEKPDTFIQAEENLTVAIQEVRRISHHMHPQILDELGLSSAIESITADFKKRTNIDVTVIKPDLRKLLPDFINTTLFRVVQESLTNIQKHANASNVIIDLSIQAKWLTLVIKDDGIGFDVAKPRSQDKAGIGLRNLTERVEYHKGSLSIESASKGTIITVKIPTTTFANHFNKSNLE
ncbi:MAG: cache domain-containing protein [Thalassotalea sp.]|nr:cache domain-containing protein [Thalassotalea sp.]